MEGALAVSKDLDNAPLTTISASSIESSQVKLLIPIMRFAFVQRANSKSQKYKHEQYFSFCRSSGCRQLG